MRNKERGHSEEENWFKGVLHRQKKDRVIELYRGKCANFVQCQNADKPTIHHILFKKDKKDNQF